MRRLSLAFLLLGCSSFGQPPTVRNTCADDTDCVSGVCDPEGLCVSTTGSDLEVAVRVIPIEDATNPTLASWTSEVFPLDGSTERDLTLPPHVDVVGTVRWQEMRVPAEIIFTRPSLGGQTTERVRVNTLAEPTTRGGMEADFVTRLEAGRMYDVEVRPSAETIPGTDMPWLRALPPMRLRQIETPTPPEDGTEVVWPVEILFPPLDVPCGPGAFAGCVLSGTVVEPTEDSSAGLQVRAVEIETGAVVSSTALTDEAGQFRIVTAPDAGPYLLRVSGGEGRPLFPTVSVDPALLPGEARIRVPAPSVVRYQGRVEGADGTPLTAATLTFESFDVFDEAVMLRGSYRTSAMTGSRGEFDVELLAGTYQVVVSPSAGQFSVLTEELRIVAPASGDPISGQLFVVPERARLGGTVRTVGDEPVPAVSVEAVALGSQDDEAPLAARFNRSGDTMTDLLGAFELRLDVGAYDVFVKPPAESGFGWVVLPGYEVASLDETSEVPFELPAPVPLRGTVRSDDGLALPGADVRVFGRAVGSERFIELGRARADAEGRYRVLLSPSFVHHEP